MRTGLSIKSTTIINQGFGVIEVDIAGNNMTTWNCVPGHDVKET